LSLEGIGLLPKAPEWGDWIMQQAYLVTGSLTDSRTIHLDEPVPVSSGKVRVIVEVGETARKMSHQEFLTWLDERQKARGHVPRTREEVDASVRTERESWDE
jgi:hypothetical protein